MKRIIGYTLGVLICLGVLVFAYKQVTGDFRVATVTFEEIPPTQTMTALNAEQQAWLDALLAQPFSWLGQGHQVFVFESADKQVVLKIFKSQRLKPSSWFTALASIPFLKQYVEHTEEKRIRRIEKLFNGYYVAYTQDPTYTGMQYIHLHLSHNLKRQIRVTDYLGFTHTLDADSLIFAIQTRGNSSKEVLTELLDKGDIEGATQHINNLFAMYMAEYQQGILDQDHNILSNTGFVGNDARRFDVGQLTADAQAKDPLVYKRDLTKIATQRIDGWLRKYYPREREKMVPEMEKQLSKLFGEPFHFEVISNVD